MDKLTNEQKTIIAEYIETKNYHSEQDIQAEVDSYNWGNIVDVAIGNMEENWEGEMIGSCYLGSLINPSGKYYLPFACSNVTECPLCKGHGIIDNPDHNERTFNRFVVMQSTLIDHCKANYGMPDKWPVEYHNKLDRIYNHLKGNDPTRVCPFCHGVGSRETYEDELFWELMDERANDNNGRIESGEGDPCDTFFCLSIESEEEKE